MTEQERDTLLQSLEVSGQLLAQAVTGVSPQVFAAKPGPEGWSIAEVVEHLCVMEGRMTSAIIPRCLRGERIEEIDTTLDGITNLVRAREGRVTGPPSVQPQSPRDTAEAAMVRFAVERDKTIAYVRTTNDDLRHHRMPHPVFGALDGYQWLLVNAAHTERHVKQIEELKALF